MFSMEKPPGKTLFIGASYVALENGGFTKALGYDTTIMVRSIFLRGYEQQCAGMVGEYMEEECGIKFLKGFVPKRFEKTDAGIEVTYAPTQGGEDLKQTFDTVAAAVGRHAVTKYLNLEAVGVKVDEKNGKIVGGDSAPGYTEGSTVSNIFAVGDVLAGRPELTPVAIRA